MAIIRIKRKTKKKSNSSILKNSLKTLVIELLPLAVKDYKSSKGKGKRNAYAVTNIVSEIRALISQIEDSIDADKLISEISSELASALRLSINRMANHITMVRQTLPSKIKNSSDRRIANMLLEGILKEYEQNMISTISLLERKVSETVKELLKKSKTKRKK